MLTKKCLICGKTIIKKPSCSLKRWNETTKYCSRECKNKSQIGKPAWNKGLTKEIDERVRKSSERMKRNNPMKRKEVKEKSSKSHTGYIMPESQRRKMSDTQKKRVKAGLNNLYIHGNYLKNRGARYTIDYKIWRAKVFARDNYTCQRCGRKRRKGDRVILNAHHIKSWAEYPELRFVVENGQTLCEECHRLTENYGKVIKKRL